VRLREPLLGLPVQRIGASPHHVTRALASSLTDRAPFMIPAFHGRSCGCDVLADATITAQAINVSHVSATRTAHALAFPPPTGTASAVPEAETSTPTQTAVATSAPTPSPTPSPTLPSPSPTATPTAVPPPPQPTCIPGAVNCNPWGYNFSPGTLIYSPPGAFCSYSSCIGNFWNGRGHVMQCQDGMFSKSGGIQGSCSYHGGNWRALYSH
jgi:hypothetical protein